MDIIFNKNKAEEISFMHNLNKNKKRRLTEREKRDKVNKVKTKKSIRSHHSANVRLWLI